jgi:hypothetical protein
MKKIILLASILALVGCGGSLQNTKSELSWATISAGTLITPAMLNELPAAIKDNNDRIAVIESTGLVAADIDTEAELESVSNTQIATETEAQGYVTTHESTYDHTLIATAVQDSDIGTTVLAPDGDGSGLSGVQLPPTEGAFEDGDKTLLDSAIQEIDGTYRIDNLTMATDNHDMWVAPYDVTITAVAAKCIGTCSGNLASISLETDAGVEMTHAELDETYIATGSDAATYLSVTANGNIDQGHSLRFDNDEASQTAETDTYLISFRAVRR